MRTKQEIQQAHWDLPVAVGSLGVLRLILEVLLDVRELLLTPNHSEK